jgi:hypothetical protein
MDWSNRLRSIKLGSSGMEYLLLGDGQASLELSGD